MELISNGAKSLEEYTYVLSLKQKISSLERSNSLTLEDYHQIISWYTELLEEYPQSTDIQDVDNIIKLTDRFSHLILSETISRLPRVMIYHYDSLSKVLKITHQFCINNLISTQQELIQQELASIDRVVQKLQLKRKKIESLNYENGNKMYEYEVYDGQKHGYYKRWYENGQLKWSLQFNKGAWLSEAKHFRLDGSIYAISSKTIDGTIFSIFADKGDLLVKMILKSDNSIHFTLLPDQRKGLKYKHKRKNNISKIGIIRSLSFSPSAWSFIWYCSRRAEIKKLLNQAVEETNRFDEFIANFKYITSK